MMKPLREQRESQLISRLLVVALMMLCLISPAFVPSRVLVLSGDEAVLPVSQEPPFSHAALIEHDPIAIYNDDMFHNTARNEGWDGLGTEQSPYIIENLLIEESATFPVVIEHSTVYFIIRNSVFDSITQEYDCVNLLNARNGIIENSTFLRGFTGVAIIESSTSNIVRNNTAIENSVGFSLIGSDRNTILENEVTDSDFGIAMWSSTENTILNNTVHLNDAGIVLGEESHYNEIIDNQVFNNQNEGIGLHSADHNNVSDNHVFENNGGIILYEYSDFNNITWNEIDNNNAAGIRLNYDDTNNRVSNNTIYENRLGVVIADQSNGNLITGNIIRDHIRYGIIIWASEDNTVEWNDFIENFAGELSQAFDGPEQLGTPNVFRYNYWSDWTSPDDEEPFRIVDIPYSISGLAGSFDRFPRTGPKLQLKLSGEFDFLLKEDIYLQIAALLTDKNTGEPISEANVTFVIYDPDHVELWRGVLLEEVSGTGVYLNRSLFTMAELKLPKGIYIVLAYAEAPYSNQVMDMIQFHIDPPGEPSLEWVQLAGVGGVALAVAIGSIWIRRRE